MALLAVAAVAIGWLGWGLLNDTVYVPGCPFHDITGLHCPGCGTTRAVRAVCRGDFRQAFAYNQLAVVILPFVGVALFNSLRAWWRNDSATLPSKWVRTFTWLLVGTMILYAVLRNLPMYPFYLLAPHEI